MTDNTDTESAGFLPNLVQQNPFGVGLLFLILGAVIGLLIPETAPENKLMGATRDDLVDKARDTANDLRNKVGAVAGTVQTAAVDAFGTVKDSTVEALSTAKDAVVEEAKQQGLVPEEK